MIQASFYKLKTVSLAEKKLEQISDDNLKDQKFFNHRIIEEELLSQDFCDISEIKQKIIEFSNRYKSEPIILIMQNHSLNRAFVVGKKYKYNDPDALFECIICKPKNRGQEEEMFRMIGKQLDSRFLSAYVKMHNLSENYILLTNIIYDEQSFRFNAIYSTEELKTELLKINKILDNDPADNNALLHKGWILSELGLFDEAISTYDAILLVQPDSDRASNLRNMALQSKLDKMRLSSHE